MRAVIKAQPRYTCEKCGTTLPVRGGLPLVHQPGDCEVVMAAKRSRNGAAPRRKVPEPEPAQAPTLLGQLFARGLVRAREAAELTQVQLAARAAISPSYLGMLERCERTPALDTIESLAQAMGIQDPRALLKGDLP